MEIYIVVIKTRTTLLSKTKKKIPNIQGNNSIANRISELCLSMDTESELTDFNDFHSASSSIVQSPNITKISFSNAENTKNTSHQYNTRSRTQSSRS